MLRSLSRGVSVRSIADYFCKSKANESVQKNVAGKLDFSRAISTTEGQDYLGSGGESISGSVQVQIVNALRLGDRSKASCLLSGLGHGSNPQGATDFFYILDYCMKTPDPLFVMETWRYMEEKDIGVSERCYFFIIRALGKGGYLQEAFNLLNFLGEIHRNCHMLPFCNSFLKSCIQMQSLVHVNLCLDLMEHLSVGKNEATYWELLKLAVWQKNISAVYVVWKEYVKNYSPSILSLRQFIWSFTRLRDLEAAYDTLQHMVALALKGRCLIDRNDEGKLIFSRLDSSLPANGEMSLKKHTIEEIEQPILSVSDNCKKMDTSLVGVVNYGAVDKESSGATGIDTKMVGGRKNVPLKRILKWSFNDVMHGSAQSQNCRKAEQLMLQMQGLGLEPSSHTYDAFIKAIVSERGFRDGIEVLKLMRRQNLKPYDSTLASLAIECSKVLQVDLAEALLEQISETLYVHPYNLYLSACDTLDLPERAVRMLSKMKQLKLQPDIRTYELLFSLFGTVNAPYEDGNMLSRVDAAKRIKAIELDMVKNGVQHSHLSMKNLLKALGAEGMIREMIQYLYIAENQLCLSNTSATTAIYNTVLHSLVEAKESHMATEIFRNMKSWGILSDAATYSIMIDCCSVIKCFRSACALVSVMVRDGFYLETVTYTALIKILLNDGGFDYALRLLDQACSQSVKPDLLLFNTILHGACAKGRIDVVEFIVEQMRQNKIKPDPSTCSYVFCAYFDSGFQNTAMEALQVLSMRMISEEESTMKDKQAEYEDFILAEDVDAELRILQLFKDSNENLALALLNLRWLAMVGVSISWSPEQSLWATRLVSGNGS